MAEASSEQGRPAALNPFPDQRDLYLLVVGAVLGLLLGPAVLGQVAPGWYDRLFIGSGEALERLEEHEAEHEQALGRLEATGATPGAAMGELEREFELRRVTLQQQVAQNRREHLQTLNERLSAFVLAALLVMVLEGLISPDPRRRRSEVPAALHRLKTARYALMALWLALVVARPSLVFEAGPLIFAALLLAVSLVVAFLPLESRAGR